MRLGLLARSEDTGLGRMSADAFNHLHPHRTVVVDVDHPLGMHLERFPGCEVANPRDPRIFAAEVKSMLYDIDTLLILETPYDPAVYQWAVEHDVRTVCVAMPEYDIPSRWGADVVVNPTPYLHSRLPDRAIIFPWPTDTSQITYRPRENTDLFLHIVGQPAAHDRNGTKLVIDAFKKMPDLNLLIRSQVPLKRLAKYPNIEVRVGNEEDVSDMYMQGDILVYPRRYAGQSLVMLEAQAAGLPLVCLDRLPENRWTAPEALIPCTAMTDWEVRRASKKDVMGAGTDGYSKLTVFTAEVDDVCTVIRSLTDSPYAVRALSDHSRANADAHSWETLWSEWSRLLSTPGYNPTLPAS